MRVRKLILAASLVGALVGIFWIFAIDAGRNYATWPPNPEKWPARLTCPFTPLVGVNNFANICVPLLNAGMYALVCWLIICFSGTKSRDERLGPRNR
jgi:hypothetical protein